MKSGAPGRDRTCNLLNRNQILYPLSYRRVNRIYYTPKTGVRQGYFLLFFEKDLVYDTGMHPTPAGGIYPVGAGIARPLRAACGTGNGVCTNHIRRTCGAGGGTGDPSPTTTPQSACSADSSPDFICRRRMRGAKEDGVAEGSGACPCNEEIHRTSVGGDAHIAP